MPIRDVRVADEYDLPYHFHNNELYGIQCFMGNPNCCLWCRHFQLDFDRDFFTVIQRKKVFYQGLNTDYCNHCHSSEFHRIIES